jgi:hypothetical protein
MEKKIGSRKLVLNRETIRELTPDELARVDGGESASVSGTGGSISVSRSQGYSYSIKDDTNVGWSHGNASISIGGGSKG